MYIATIEQRKVEKGQKVNSVFLMTGFSCIKKYILAPTLGLVLGLLAFALDSPLAHGYCGDKCLYETSMLDRDFSLSLEERIIARNLANYSIGNAMGSSDSFALNMTDSAGTVGENSGGVVIAANDSNTDSGSQTADSKDWEFILAPYAWLMGLNGDLTIKGRSANVDLSFSDLIEHFDIGGMLHGEVLWKRKFGFYVDTTLAKLSADKDIHLQKFDPINLKLTSKLFLLEFAGIYRAGTWNLGSPENNFTQKSKPTITLDLLAGGRYWYMKNELDINSTIGVLPPEINDSQNWFDFIVGGRVGLNLYKKLTGEVRTDIGGFGLSFSSDFAWNIVTVIAYELPWYRITPLIGYRALYDDYSNGSGNNRFENNTWIHGPVIGVAFRF